MTRSARASRRTFPIHISDKRRHNNHVAFFIVLIAVEAVLVLLAAPVKVCVKAYADVVSLRLVGEVRAWGARVLEVASEKGKYGVRLRINGKTASREERSVKPSRTGAELLSEFKSKVRINSGLLLLSVGGEDAATGAMMWGSAAALCALLPSSIRRRIIYSPCEKKFTLQIVLDLRISVLSATLIALSALKRFRAARG